MKYKLETVCVQGSINMKDSRHFGAVSMPIYQTATFAHPELGESTGYDYSRVKNPTRDEVQKVIAMLEHGTDAYAFSSGMAAISALMEIFLPGDHIVATSYLYGGTFRLFENINRKNGIKVSYIDADVINEIDKYIKKETKAIFLETPSNPLMQVFDISKVSEIARKNNCMLIVDNTFLTPVFQTPLDFGADIVIHSGTKYLGGHNDTLAGFLVTNREDLSEKINNILKTTGSGLSPMDSWLILRGLKTLALRMKQHSFNAVKIAEWLTTQEPVKEVYFIGLKNHPSSDIIERQCKGYGGMISFRVQNAEAAKQILNNIKIIRFAESLGGVESLMTYPMRQTHAEVPEERRKALGVDETLLRLSVGIEDVTDLINDLKQAFDNI